MILEGKSKSELLDKISKLKSEKLQKTFTPYELGSLFEFCKYIDGEFFTDEKHKLKEIADALQKSILYAMGENKYSEYSKIVLNLFPRLGKSYITSLSCLYALGFNNNRCIMRNTSTQNLAQKFSRDIRNFIQLEKDIDNSVSLKELDGKQLVNQRVHDIFPDMKLSNDKRSLDSWALKTAKDLSYISSGVGGTIVGLGCDLLGIIDDPYSGVKDALNPKVTDELMSWYEGEHRRRFSLGRNVSEIIVMQRWTDDDFCGRLVSLDSSYNVISIDAEVESELPEEDYENIESSCEAIISTDRLRSIKKNMYNNGEGIMYQSQYRNRTYQGENNMFPLDSLKRYSLEELEHIKESANYKIGVLDFADEGEDFLSSVIGLLHEGKWYILPSLVFTQKSTTYTKGFVSNQIMKENPKFHIFESNSGGKGFAQQIEDVLAEIDIRGVVRWERNDSNKHTRILSFEDYIKSNFVFLEEKSIKPNSDYFWFMFHLTRYKRDGSYKKDDAPDSLAMLAKNVRVNYGCSFGRL